MNAPANLDEVFTKYGPIACRTHIPFEGREYLQDHYSCMRCNKFYRRTDTDFVFYQPFSDYNYLVKAGLARAGDPMCLIRVEPVTRHPGYGLSYEFPGGYGKLGWFGHCADEDACAKRKANIHAHVHPEQEALAMADHS